LRITFEQQAARDRTLKGTAVPSTPTLRFASESDYEPHALSLPPASIANAIITGTTPTCADAAENVWAGDAWSKETRRVSLLFLHPEHSRVASHVQEGIEVG